MALHSSAIGWIVFADMKNPEIGWSRNRRRCERELQPLRLRARLGSNVSDHQWEPPAVASDLYILTILDAYSDQVNFAACMIPAVLSLSHWRSSVHRKRSISVTLLLQAATSPTGQYVTALPPTSRNTSRSLATTGVPQAIASTIGSPKPSRSDGKSTNAARRYKEASVSLPTLGSTRTDSCSLSSVRISLCSAVNAPPTCNKRALGSTSLTPENTLSRTSIRFLGIVLPTCSRSICSFDPGPSIFAACASAVGSGSGEHEGCTPLGTTTARSAGTRSRANNWVRVATLSQVTRAARRNPLSERFIIFLKNIDLGSCAGSRRH